MFNFDTKYHPAP